MADHVSRYAVVSDDVFVRSASAVPVRLVYLTKTAKLYPVPAEVASELLLDRCSHIAESDLDALRGLGIVGAFGVDEEFDGVLQHQRDASANQSVRRFNLLPTAFCNMACAYCGQGHRRENLSPRHRADIVERIARAGADPQVDAVRVNWYGGEPLLALDLIRQLSQAFLPALDATGTKYHGVVVTNGALLSHRVLKVLHDDCRVRHIEVTIDGPGEVHDRHRPLKSGRSSYGRLLALLSEVVTGGMYPQLQLGIRTNVDVDNAAFVDQLIDELAAAGLADDRVRYDIHGVHSWGNDVSGLQVSTASLHESETRWLARAAAAGLRVGVLPDRPMDVVCSAVDLRAETIAPSGDVYSCTEEPLVPGIEERTSLGLVEAMPPGGRTAGAYDDWHDSVQQGRHPCRACTFLPVCGGACPKLWREGKPPCPTYKDGVQGRMSLAGQQAGYELAT